MYLLLHKQGNGVKIIILRELKRSVFWFILLVVVMGSAFITTVNAATYDDLVNQKTSAHRIATEARNIGLDENHEIIVGAKELWAEADNRLAMGDYEVKKVQEPVVQYYTDNDVTMLAKLMFGEGRGIQSKTQLACIVWTVLNRVDAGYGSISSVVTAKNQYHYRSGFSTVSDYGYDLKALALDILSRWNLEKNGLTSEGRVLPTDYLYFHGTGKENKFRNNYSFSKATFWNYSLASPYEN